jgi:hypothetical protein
LRFERWRADADSADCSEQRIGRYPAFFGDAIGRRGAGLEYLPAAAVLKALGGLIAAYAAFTVSSVTLPAAVGGRAGAWGMGAVAGSFDGAFDITGPAQVVHGQSAGWGAGFRRNLLAVVAISRSVVVSWDAVSGRKADYYYLDLLTFTVPVVAVGMVAGKFLSKELDPAAFLGGHACYMLCPGRQAASHVSAGSSLGTEASATFLFVPLPA